MHAASRPSRADRRSPAGQGADGGALAFLSEILVGDHAWTTAEVQRLVVMRESAELGRWRDTGLDDEATIAG